MCSLVRFVAVDNKESISKAEYVEKIVRSLMDSDFISLNSEQKNDYEIIEEIDDVGNVFGIKCKKDNLYDFEIFFEYRTYNGKLQLEISIQSDTYKVEPENDYLENIKFTIKKSIVKDWQKIIWLIDKDAECLSIELYPRFYRVENSLRELINTVLTKQYGVDWWDQLVPCEIKNKHKSRLKEYKRQVPAFANIDERLMSIDIDDLGKIIKLEKYKWNPTYNEQINQLMEEKSENRTHRLIELLEMQRTKELDLWDKHFSNYLPEDFNEKFLKFTKDRNHIMHNKLIDRNAFRMINSTADDIAESINKALCNTERFICSDEDIEFEKQLIEECDHLCRENDAGVSIRTSDEIKELFQDKIQELVEDIEDFFRFRNDIEVENQDGCWNNLSGKFLICKSLVNTKELELYYEMSLVDEEGSESELSIICKAESESFNESIRYTNAEVSYDEDMGLYMPYIEDEIGDISVLTSKLEEFINKQLPDYRELVDDANIARKIYCYECCEESIYIGEDILPFGTCLCCGHLNELYRCDVCGKWINLEEGEFKEDDKGIKCLSCLKAEKK